MEGMDGNGGEALKEVFKQGAPQPVPTGSMPRALWFLREILGSRCQPLLPALGFRLS